jgi:hypothetical protein
MADADEWVTHEVDRGDPRQGEHCSAMAVGCLRRDRLRRSGDPGVGAEIDDPSCVVLEVLDRQMSAWLQIKYSAQTVVNDSGKAEVITNNIADADDVDGAAIEHSGVADTVQEKHSGGRKADSLVVDVNLLPDTPWSTEKLGGQPFDVYLGKYMQDAGLPMLSYDEYPAGLDSSGQIYIAPTYHSNLKIAMGVAQKANVPLWSFIGCEGHGSDDAVVHLLAQGRISELRILMRYLAYVSVAHGAQVLQYFRYQSSVNAVESGLEMHPNRDAIGVVGAVNWRLHQLAHYFFGSPAETVGGSRYHRVT